MYVAIDRKPKNVCEIQNSADGDSGVMLQLKLVKMAGDEVDNLMTDDTHSMLHGTKVVKELIKLWIDSGWTVYGNSYFASASCVEEMARIGMEFI